MIDLVVTLIGRDRPGLVEAVALTIVDHGGNWLESRMIHLAGKFAGILRVEVPPERQPALVRALEGLVGATGLKILVEAGERAAVRPVGASAPPPAAPERTSPGLGPRETAPPAERLMDVELLGLDRPGLVREISQLLAQHGVNVEELVTDRSGAPMSGEMLFRAHARVKVPGGIDAARLRASIERLASDLSMEIRVDDSDGKRGARKS